jgi:hypothetical protein
MIRTRVVSDFILNDLDAETVRPIDQFTQLVYAAEVFFDSIKVLRIVAMKACAGFPSLSSI